MGEKEVAAVLASMKYGQGAETGALNDVGVIGSSTFALLPVELRVTRLPSGIADISVDFLRKNQEF